MREVTQFVVVFPDRLIRAGEGERALLVDALRREYPHYQFEVFPGRGLADDEEFNIIPVVGVAGHDEDSDPDRIYMCRPLDPKVIPDLVATLRAYEALGATVN